MAYKCPLCLKELGVTDKLIRYCYQCDLADFVKGNAENLGNSLKCKKANCKTHGQIEAGVYFAHLNCEKSNPFWNGNTLNIPDNAAIDGIEITLPFSKGDKSFKHWQINLLNKTVNSGAVAKSSNEKQNISEVNEMWFPALLLKSSQERRAGKKTGQGVALIGTKKAGKTILALQVLDEEGYVSPNLNEKIEIEDYLYCTRLEGVTIQPIFELLRLRSAMWANRPFYVPPPTVRETVNFYTVFYSPTKAALEKKQTTETNGKSDLIGQAVDFTEKANSFWEKIVAKFKEIVGAPGNSKKPFRFALSLYDVAGENFEKEVEQIEQIKSGVDKIALVIDAADLVENSETQGFLAEHRRALKKLKDIGNKPYCVVLTKTDLFVKYLETIPYFNYEIGENRQQIYQGNQTIIKELLENWRKTIAANADSENRPTNLLNFLNDLVALDAQNPVFMVETRNLPTDAEQMVEKQPFSMGIDNFVCWCLEIEREEIIEPL